MIPGIDAKKAWLAFGCILTLGLSACSQDAEMASDEPAAPAEPEPYVFDRAPVPPSPPQSDLVGRGEYLVETIGACGNCHSGRDDDGNFVPGLELAGNFVIDEGAFTAYAPNLTPDPETGIGEWTDAEIERAIREGIARDGRVMLPPMAFAYFRDISSNDMAAIIAYLRSVPAVRREVPMSVAKIPEAMPPSWGPPVTEPIPDIPRSDRLAYGRYLTHTVGHCTQCHSPLTPQGEDFSRIGAGMNIYPRPFGANVQWSAVAANITQHETLGIGAWTDDEIKRAITQGISRDGRQLLPFMAFDFYNKISDEDLELIVEYVKTFPPSEAVSPVPE
ncbi:MAG: c-type cytochrome [Gammaproteobacteria bacterium]|jgi:mono/diheme cytochrome c family protein